MVKIVEHGTWTMTEDDEARHAPQEGQLWNESYYFDFVSEDGSIGGYVRLGLYPNWGRSWYWACVTGPGRPLVIVSDNNAPLPAEGETTIQADAYRAEQEVTETFEAARLKLDAVAHVLAQAADAYGDLEGTETTKLSFDLEWKTVGGVYCYKDTPRYEIPCTVTGTVQVGDETFAITASGERDHSWGSRDWWSNSWMWTSGRLEDGTWFHGTQVNIGFPYGWPSFVFNPPEELEHVDGFSGETTFGEDGFPVVAYVRLKGVRTKMTPLAFAPVSMTSPDNGAVAHFARAMCRFEAEDGRTGYGWTEWHQPPGWDGHDWSDLCAAASSSESGS